MENENTQTAESRDNEHEPLAGMSELSAENIEGHISTELAKVVGIDKKTLETYVAFLGTMKAAPVESMLKTLKDNLGEQLIPLLEIMTHHDQKNHC
jgi:hypothetical protein